MGNLSELIAQFQSAARFYYDLAFRNGRDQENSEGMPGNG
jgi:hypothetical protein